jgi:DUF4097 and DUF4098 domain-containing protein YvlB
MHPILNRIRPLNRAWFALAFAAIAWAGSSNSADISTSNSRPFPALVNTAESPEPGVSREFHSEIERDYNLRSIGQLQITNLRGPVSVQGWAQDKIRVKAKRTVFATNEDEAKKLFAAIDFRYQESEGNIEFSGQYGQGLSIAERIEERTKAAHDPSKTARMEMVVFAPSNLKLKIWAAEGAVSLKGWTADVEMRSSSGTISGDSLKGSRVSCLCESCSVDLKNARGSIRGMSNSGNLSLVDVDATDIYLESSSGTIFLRDTSADQQLLVTKTGSILAKNVKGSVEFHTQRGHVSITGLKGFASGKSDNGDIEIQAHSWNFSDNALIESQHGNVSVALPSGFAGDVDVFSQKGTVDVDFPLKRSAEAPVLANHWIGRIGEEATDLLKIFSDTGNVKLFRSN